MLTAVVAQYCRTQWAEWFTGPTPTNLDVAFVPSRARSDERAVALVFASRRLRAVVKLAVGDRSSLAREAAALQSVQKVSGLSRVAPRILGTGCEQIAPRDPAIARRGVLWALPMEPVAGRMWRPPGADEVVSLRGYQRVEGVLRELDDLGAEVATLEPVAELGPLGIDWRQGLDLVGVDVRHREGLEERYGVGRAVGEGRPSVAPWVHGDLAPGNVRLSSSGVAAVLDWEMLDRGLEPWFDRLYPALLSISSVVVRRGHLAAGSWPVRWLNGLSQESGSIPVGQRCLRATAELASRSSRLRRGSLERWVGVAELLQDPAGPIVR